MRDKVLNYSLLVHRFLRLYAQSNEEKESSEFSMLALVSFSLFHRHEVSGCFYFYFFY